jgi:hypothetical protein
MKRGAFVSAIYILNYGPDGSNTASVNYDLGLFYCQLAGVQTTVNLMQKQILVAKAHFEESVRIHTKIHGSTHPVSIYAASELAAVSSDLIRISPAKSKD